MFYDYRKGTTMFRSLALLALSGICAQAFAVDAVTVDAAGRVGVGTSTPMYNLDIIGIVGSQNSTNANNRHFVMRGYNGNTWDLYGGHGGGGYFGIAENQGSPMLSIQATTGYVGIGTHVGSVGTTARLHVKGGQTTNTQNLGLLRLQNVYTASGGAPFNRNSVGIDFANGDGGSANGTVAGIYASTAEVVDLRFCVNSQERMHITSDGNVGIGTTTPQIKLETREDGAGANWMGRMGSSNATSDRTVFLGTYLGKSVIASHNFALNAWKPLYVNTVDGGGGGDVYMGGNVGIGTNTPTEKLHVNGNVLASILGASGIFPANSSNQNTKATLECNADFVTPGNRSRILRVCDRAFMDFTLITGGRGILTFGTDFGGRRDAMSIDTNTGNVEVAGTFKCYGGVYHWPDFVFEPTYVLKPLSEVEAFVKAEKHLPGIPDEKEVKAKGVDMTGMLSLHLQKIEELTLYTIQQEKDIAEQKKENATQKAKITDLESRLAAIEALLKK